MATSQLLQEYSSTDRVRVQHRRSLEVADMHILKLPVISIVI
jgi:hypothetical protein